MLPEFINYILEENGGVRTMVFKDSYFCIHPTVTTILIIIHFNLCLVGGGQKVVAADFQSLIALK